MQISFKNLAAYSVALVILAGSASLVAANETGKTFTDPSTPATRTDRPNPNRRPLDPPPRPRTNRQEIQRIQPAQTNITQYNKQDK